MAEGFTAESVKVILGHLECSICCTRYNQPKNMDCSHSYCLKCLQELKKTQNPDTNKLKCPLCQKETILPLDGVTGLQSNYLLIALVEEVNKQEQLPHGEESKVMCQACDEENAAISRCLNCEHYLCLECHKAHQRLAALKNHEIKTLAELQEVDETQTESKMNISRCDIHPIQELCLYCMTCEQLTCKLCAVQQHKQPMHNLTDLLTAVEICQTEASNGVSQLQRSKFNIAAMRNRLSCLFQETNNNISYHTEQKLEQTRREEIRLKQSAKFMYQKKEKNLAKLQFAEKTMSHTHGIMTNKNRLEILKNRQEFFNKYEHDVIVHEDQEEELTYDLSFIAFCEVENEVELGTLLNKEKWELMSEVGADTACLSSYSTGDIVAVLSSQINILRQLGKDFKTISQIKCKDISRPTAIAVNNEDHLIVLDNPNVKTLNKEFQLLHQFTPGKESGSKLTCLAVDENNLIAVGYKDKGEVSLHNPDGSLIRTLSAPGIDEYMAISNQRIIYTCNKKLIFVDYQGNKKIETTIFECDKGLCCDIGGDIYVLYPKRIQHLSADQGKHVEWIVINQTDGDTITCTQQGKLVIHKNKYRYVLCVGGLPFLFITES
ncbi:tripartite motif-containing protein 55-like isoform X1 [Asterias rubens]|uniref:tripartite motif-containing protein 55-like isoform X1 n=1 Tax=Asterias rubens TaxID=7604 RepID=UPI001455B3CE|nr:tripartite motif-containing protein 55-like isoform X1 [Asterias rubens]